MHSENIHIKQLFHLVTNSLSKILTEMKEGNTTHSATAIEVHAQNIFSRVAEIDNAFKNLSITLEYLKKTDYADSKYNFSEHHTFHIENFLLKLISIIDRSYLLAGSTMSMENHKIERLGGNKKVYKKLTDFSAESAGILNKMSDAAEELRATRNKVAHQSGYSSKNITVLQTIEIAETESICVKEITDIMSYEEIKDIVIGDAIESFSEITLTMDLLVKELIDSLSFVYTGLVDSA
nr:Cthe_2314 family HEPN domain-containing protein [Pseudoalteromonas sp. TB13]